MRKLLFMAYLLSILLIQNSFGFDDNRKGFIVGLGAGVHNSEFIVADQQRPIEIKLDLDGALATSFKIGYGFNDKFLLHYTSDVSFNKLTLRSPAKDMTLGVGTIGGTYYLNSQSPSAFITAGYGVGIWKEIGGSQKDSLKGSGWILGGGYEFDKHINIELSMLKADFSGDSKLENRFSKYEVSSIRFTINYLWY